MSEVPKTLTEQLRSAAERGQVVLVPTIRLNQRVMNPPPPQRSRDEESLAGALCLLFKLCRSEGYVLMKMASQDFITKNEIFASAIRDDQKKADMAVSVMISVLRKKLAPHGIEIVTLRGFGYGLHKASRAKICRRLSKYDAALIPTTPLPPDAA